MVNGEIVGVLDADSIPDESFLRRVIIHFEESGATAIQGMTESINAQTNLLTRIASLEEAIWFKAMINGKERLGLFVPLTGSCQFIKAETLRSLGGWSESSLAEDVELAIRLAERGYRVKFCRDVFSFQETPPKLSQMFKQRLRWYRGYIETAIEHRRLLGSLNRVLLDAELSLLGPTFITFSFVGYLLSWLVFVNSTFPLTKILAYIIIAFFSIPLLVAGFLSSHVRRSKGGFNLLLVPFIYAYWLLQTIIATYAVLSSILHRPKVWVKTER
jgi:cellulose synthase/poly-beta-1,6-N-acetylglucosamine synthase-like glycosyltransferase